MTNPTPPEEKKTKEHPLADLSPEQLRTLLASDLGRKTAVRKESRESPRRRLFWAGVVLLVAMLYVIVRFTTAPSKVLVVNTSGEDAASIIVISGTQRIDLGGVANGEVRKVELMPGKPVAIEYTFDRRRVWTDAEPLAGFHSLTVFVGIDKKLRVVREAPWAQVAQPPQVESPARRRRSK